MHHETDAGEIEPTNTRLLVVVSDRFRSHGGHTMASVSRQGRRVASPHSCDSVFETRPVRWLAGDSALPHSRRPLGGCTCRCMSYGHPSEAQPSRASCLSPSPVAPGSGNPRRGFRIVGLVQSTADCVFRCGSFLFWLACYVDPGWDHLSAENIGTRRHQNQRER